MNLVIKCPKSGCPDDPLCWIWNKCKHTVFLSDEADVRRLFNTFSYGALTAISTTSLLRLVLNARTKIMEQNMINLI